MRWCPRTRPGLPVLSALCAWLGSSTVHALEPLDAHLRHAETHAFDMRSAEAEVAEQRHALARGRAAFAPTLQATGRYVRNQYEAIARVPNADGQGVREAVFTPKNLTDLTLSADMPLFDLGRFRQLTADKHGLDASQANQVAQGLDVKRRVGRSYFGVVAAEALVQAAERAVAASENNLGIVRARREAGLASELDERRAEAELEQKRKLLADAEYERATTRRALETESGLLTSEGALPLVPAEFEEEALAVWLGRVGDGLPSLRAARENRLQNQALTRYARAQLAPTITANATEKFTNAPGFGKQPNYAVGVSASLRFDAAALPQIRKQEASELALQVAEDKARRAAADAVHDAWHDVKRQREKHSATARELTAARLAARVAHERFTAGTANFLDVVLAERDELSAEATHIQAGADLCTARLELRLYAGISEVSQLCQGAAP
jgi:outer membrane protein TolC